MARATWTFGPSPICRMNLALVFIALLCAASTTCGHCQQQMIAGPSGDHRPATPVFYGELDVAPLADFAPMDLAPAFTALQQKQLAEAARQLESAVRTRPNEKAAWIGLMQCKRELWRDECVKLEHDLANTPSDTTLQFKLGTLLYYRWMQGEYSLKPLNKPTRIEKGSGLTGPITIHQPVLTEDRIVSNRAAHLLREAWTRGRIVVAGMMLVELISKVTQAGPRDPILEGLVRELGGPKAYAAYQHAKASGWRVEPPAALLVNAENRRPLCGVLKEFWSRSTERASRGTMVNGKIVWTREPTSPDRLARAAYLDRWIQALSTARVIEHR